MSYTIIGETVKSATSVKLGEIFGTTTTRYKESITNVKYPHFFISQVNLDVTPAGRDRIRLDYLMNIRYRIASDLATQSNIQQKLDDIGLKLCSQLLTLDIGLPVHTRNRTYTKEDGVLQFTFEVTLFATPSKAEEPTIDNLKIKEEVI